MKSIFYVWLLSLSSILYSQYTFAQTPSGRSSGPPKIGTIKGMVYDSAQQQALEFATISVFQQKDSALVGGAITSEKGDFVIEELPVGKLYVAVNYMGYTTYTASDILITFQNKSVNLPPIYLVPTPATLKTAEVTADRAVFQLGLDKKVFNVDKTNLGDSENATEVLRNTPTVEVDFDGNVKIRGGEVQVYINGKPTGLTGDSQAEILDQLPANMIKKVELITSPSAKYDPEGGSGIINIVLKKNVLEGFTGSANVSVGTSTWNPFGRYRGGLSLNFRTNKINIFSNFSYNNNQRLSRSYNYRLAESLIDTSSLEQFNNRKGLRSGGMIRLGMDYYFDDYNTLTVAGRLRPSGGSSTGDIQYDFKNAAGEKTSITKRLIEEQQERLAMTYNVIYSKVFKSKKKKDEKGVQRRDNSKDNNLRSWGRGRNERAAGRSGTMGDKQELVIDLQYSMQDRFENEFFWQQQYQPDWQEYTTAPDSQITSRSNQMHQGTMRIDYTHPISKDIKFEAGYKGNIRWLGNDFKVSNYDFALQQSIPDTGLTNNFQFLEQVHALYATFSHKIGKLQYTLGLRGEYTLANSRLVFPNDNSFINNYFSVFPTLNIVYELKDNQQVQLGFSRRIQRPTTWALNPFPSISDPLNLRYGNPYLLPQFTNAVELSYVNYWKGGNTFMLTGFYRYNTDLIESLRNIRSDGVVERTFFNFSTSHLWGAELVTRFVPYKWWNFGLTGSLYQNIQDGTNIDENFQVNALAGNANAYMNFNFKFGMRVSLYMWFSFPSFVPQGWQSGYVWNSISVSQKVLKNKGTITLSVQNPVWGGRFGYETRANGFYQAGLSEWEAPVFELRFSYRFGKVNVRAGRSKNAGRLNSGNSGGGGGEPGGEN